MLPGIHVDNYWVAMMVAIVLAFLNTIVKPILTVLTIPITIFTLGFFLLVINALMIILADKMVEGFTVKGFWWALLISFALSILTSILNMVFGVNQRREEE